MSFWGAHRNFFKLPTRLDVEVLRNPTGILKITTLSQTRKTTASVGDAIATLIPETLTGARMRNKICFAHLCDRALDEEVSLETAFTQPHAERKLATANVTKPLTALAPEVQMHMVHVPRTELASKPSTESLP